MDAGALSHTGRIWFTMFAIVGTTSGILAAALLWLIVTRPLLVAQLVAGLR